MPHAKAAKGAKEPGFAVVPARQVRLRGAAARQGGGLVVRFCLVVLFFNCVVFGILLYVSCWAMWMFASFSLAKAKGYGPDCFGAVLIFLYIFAFCFPVLSVIYTRTRQA
jgi:hypothetical protein